MLYIISMIQTLQIIIHFPIQNISFPATIMKFYEILIPFVMFDILDSSETINEEFEKLFNQRDT